MKRVYVTESLRTEIEDDNEQQPPAAEAGGFIEGLCLSHLRARAGQENLSIRGTATPLHQLQVARCYIRRWFSQCG